MALRGRLSCAILLALAACTPGSIQGGHDSGPVSDARDVSRDTMSADGFVADVQSGDPIDAANADTPTLDTPPTDPCASRPCPSWQRCIAGDGGMQCVDPCTGITCSPPEMCFATDTNGRPFAMDMYGAPIGVCMDPCATVTCPSNQACVPGAHGAPLGVCIDRCDCRNCGNCGSDGSFVGYQAFCGNPSGMPATMACTVPCTGGAGCIPWDAQGGICWPLEGCFSL